MQSEPGGTIMVIAGLVAGGSGTRMKQAMPKQFLLLDSIPQSLHDLDKDYKEHILQLSHLNYLVVP